MIPDGPQLDRLLLKEKERRGVGKDDLVFVGIHNVAQYYWCAMQAVLKSRAGELGFFGAYLEDRIQYARHLGLISDLPTEEEALLDVGNEIVLNNVYEILEENAKRLEESMRFWQTIARRSGFDETRPEGAATGDEEESPMMRGHRLQQAMAEKHPTIRWNFQWRRYVLVGVPDGTAKTFVYEFKTTRNRWLMRFQKPVAVTQADLYGRFFQKRWKKVQIHIVEEALTETFKERVDAVRAEQVLTDFERVDAGWIPPAPVRWKCRQCEVRADCSIVGK